MPPVVAYAAAIGGTHIFGTITVGAVLQAAASVAISTAIGRALAPKLPDLADTGKTTAGSALQLQRNPDQPRRVVYGETRVSGLMAFASTSTTTDENDTLHMVIVLSVGEVAAIGDTFWLNDVEVDIVLPFNAPTTGPFVGLLEINRKLGPDSGTYQPIAGAEAFWTVDHRGRGLAYIGVTMIYDTTAFPGGIPNISTTVKGRKIFDPRDEAQSLDDNTTWAWTDNPALCLLDYLINVDFGLGFDYASEIDVDSFIAAANICDEDVALATEGTEKRYRCSGAFDNDIDPPRLIEQILATMDGILVPSGGKLYLYTGAWREPTVTLTADDLRGGITVRTRDAIRDSVNRVRGTYTSPDDLYQPRDFPAVINATYLSEDNGFEHWLDLNLPWVFSASQAQRLAKINLERARQGIVVTFPAKLTALRLRKGDNVLLTLDRYGWDEKAFMVIDWRLAIDDEGRPGIDLVLRETASAIYDWDAEETAVDPAPDTDLPAGYLGLG